MDFGDTASRQLNRTQRFRLSSGASLWMLYNVVSEVLMPLTPLLRPFGRKGYPWRGAWMIWHQRGSTLRRYDADLPGFVLARCPN